MKFLEALRTAERSTGHPPVLASLRDRVLPAFSRRAEEAERLGRLWLEEESFREVSAWCKEWFSGKRWVIPFALHTLAIWHRAPEAVEQLRWHPPAFEFEEPLEDEERELRHPGWHFETEEFEEFEQRLIDYARRDYRERIQGLLGKRGWSPATERRNPAHHNWLVQRRYFDKSWEDIAKADPAGERLGTDAIRKAATALARRIDLPAVRRK